MFKFLRNVTFVTMVAVTPYTQATIYSWIDDDGHTHFSDLPDSEGAQEIEVQVISANLAMCQTNSSNQQSQGGQQKNNQKSNNQQGQGNQKMPPPPNGQDSNNM